MQIQVNTDRNIAGHEALATRVTGTVGEVLEHYKEHISRVEIHLSDENSGKKGGKDDKRCLLEARLNGKDPLAVSHLANTTIQALAGALDKLTRKLDSTLGRQRDKRTRPGQPVTEVQEASDET